MSEIPNPIREAAMTSETPRGVVLLIDSCHGIWVPRIFGHDGYAEAFGISDEDRDILMTAEPSEDGDAYWETWDRVLDYARYEEPRRPKADGSPSVNKDFSGHLWTLHQDGGLFALCPALMTGEELEAFGIMYEIDEDGNRVFL